MNNPPVLACKGVVKTFSDDVVKTDVLKNIDFQVSAGESVAIIGASGTGKSTLLHLLGGLDESTQGDIFWQGKNINTFSEKQRCQFRNTHLGFIYQFHHLLPEFDALENVAMPLLIRNEKPRLALQAAEVLLKKVGLGHRLNHKVTQLSGGEKQRVAVARALVTKPKCVLADEPTGNLDQATARTVFDVMLDLQQEFKTSYVVVTHDVGLAERLQRQLNLVDGVLGS